MSTPLWSPSEQPDRASSEAPRRRNGKLLGLDDSFGRQVALIGIEKSIDWYKRYKCSFPVLKKLYTLQHPGIEHSAETFAIEKAQFSGGCGMY